jgi:hypothetical protein
LLVTQALRYSLGNSASSNLLRFWRWADEYGQAKMLKVNNENADKMYVVTNAGCYRVLFPHSIECVNNSDI